MKRSEGGEGQKRIRRGLKGEKDIQSLQARQGVREGGEIFQKGRRKTLGKMVKKSPGFHQRGASFKERKGPRVGKGARAECRDIKLSRKGSI